MYKLLHYGHEKWTWETHDFLNPSYYFRFPFQIFVCSLINCTPFPCQSKKLLSPTLSFWVPFAPRFFPIAKIQGTTDFINSKCKLKFGLSSCWKLQTHILGVPGKKPLVTSVKLPDSPSKLSCICLSITRRIWHCINSQLGLCSAHSWSFVPDHWLHDQHCILLCFKYSILPCYSSFRIIDTRLS